MRVIQWTTGKAGKLSLRGILDDPRLELAGVYAYSEQKAGVDAGQLCGRPDTGIVATTDIDALIALGADAVLYTPFMADLDHVVKLLESGLNVLSTNLFLNVGGVAGQTREALAAACARGNSSLYITGIHPGWANSITTALTAVCRDVQSITIVEAADVSVYESVETWEMLGISKREASPDVIEIAKLGMISFRDSVERMGVALGFDEFDSIDFDIEFATAAETVDLGWMRIEKDTIAALRGGWSATLGGKTILRTAVVWHLTTKLNADWDLDEDHYNIVIHGEPEVRTRIRFVAPESWGNHEWDTMTAMPAVNAVIDVVGAPAGILTLKDVGLTCAPAKAWLGS